MSIVSPNSIQERDGSTNLGLHKEEVYERKFEQIPKRKESIAKELSVSMPYVPAMIEELTTNNGYSVALLVPQRC